MTSKVLIFLTTCVLLQVHAADIEKRENAESYITKEAAKELRNKLSHIKNDGNVEEQQDDYDEILKEIIHTIQHQGSKEQKQQQQQQKHQQPTVFYEKKYFDYLPNEISDSDDVTSDDSSHELVKKYSEYNSLEEEQQRQHMVNNDDENVKHGRRIVKRDVMQQDGENKGRTKRQNFVYVPLTHYAPNPRVHFYYPSFDPFFTDIFNPLATESRQFQSFGAVPQQLVPQQYDRGINPYSPQANPNMRFHPANNFYLPPSPTYLPAVQPNQQPNNFPYPPDNQGNKIGVNQNEEFDNRVGGFEGDEDKPVWSMSLIPNNNRGGGSSSQTRPVAQAPIHQIHHQQNQQVRPHRPNVITDDEKVFTPNEKQPEIEIEYAPELEEDVTSTTRASVKLPNRKKNQQNRNMNRQKKEDLETTAKPPSAAIQQTSNVQSLYSQQVNSPKPQKPLSKCVEAIVSCCSKYDDVVRVPCFEAHNCNGAFFGQNPCSRSIKEAAFKEVEKYTK